MSKPSPEEEERLLAQGKLDDFFAEIEENSEIIRSNPVSIQQLTGYYHRWEYMRSRVFRAHWQLVRELEDVRDEYNEGLRALIYRGLTGREASGSYEERKEIYKTKNLGVYKKLRNLEKFEQDTKTFSFFIEKKLRWIEELRREIRKDMEAQRFDSTKNYMGEVDVNK